MHPLNNSASDIILFVSLPPRMYEIINCSIATTSFVALVICLRYLYIEYRRLRGGARFVDAVTALLELRLAVGLTVFLCGEFPRMTWVWLARWLANTGHMTAWMSTKPWVFVPVIASALSVLGMACVVRALTPRVWGAHGYTLAIGSALAAVAITQVFR